MLSTCSETDIVIFLINLTCTVVIKIKRGSKEHINSLFQGDCTQTSKLSTIIHVVINVFITLLLGALNMCMQLLAAPTRSGIDKAHKKNKWLDIGVPSLRKWSARIKTAWATVVSLRLEMLRLLSLGICMLEPIQVLGSSICVYV